MGELTEGQKAVMDRLEREVGNLTAQIKEKKEELEQKDKLIEKQESRLREKVTTLEQKEEEIRELKKKIEDLRMNGEDLERKLVKQKGEFERDIEREKEITAKARKELKENTERAEKETRKKVEELKKKEETVQKLKNEIVQYEDRFGKWRSLLEDDAKFKLYFLIQDTGPKSFSDMAKILGVPTPYVQKLISELKEKSLVVVEGEKVKQLLP